MARYAYHIYPKGDIDYTMSTDEHPRTFVTKVLNKTTADVSAANSHTRHEIEQMYMNDPDSSFGKAMNKRVFTSDARRESVKKGRMVSLRAKTIKDRGLGNSGG